MEDGDMSAQCCGEKLFTLISITGHQYREMCIRENNLSEIACTDANFASFGREQIFVPIQARPVLLLLYARN